MRTDSAIWSPIVSTGLSEVIGSWKIIEMRLPRTARICLSESSVSSVPSNRTEPLICVCFGLSDTSRMTDSADTLLPQPDSPTMHSVSPRCTSNETPSTARTVPSRVRKWVRRSRTDSTASAAVAVAAATGACTSVVTSAARFAGRACRAARRPPG